MKNMKYIAPEAEVLTFAKEDVITASGDTAYEWELPPIDLGSKWSWSEDAGTLKM